MTATAPVKNFCFKFTALVIEKINKTVPSCNMRISKEKLDRLQLADKNFLDKKKVDILLGVPEVPQFHFGEIHFISDNLIAINSKLGHLICGSISNNEKKMTQSLKVSIVENKNEIIDDLNKFWETEDEPQEEDEAEICEKHFQKHLRRIDGRYEVAIPFKEGLELGESLPMCKARYWQLLKSLDRDPLKKKMYSQAIEKLLDDVSARHLVIF